MSTLQYIPPPTVAKFLQSDKFANFIIGPYGSGKTVGMLFKIVKMAKEQRIGPSGVRKFRAIVVRNTGAQLNDTSIKSWMDWFPEGVAGTYERTNKIFHLRFDDVQAEVWFRALDTAEDVRRLLSVEANLICFDETREIHPDIYAAACGRVGRYPSKKDGGAVKDDGSPNFGVCGATNPPDYDSFWEQLFSNPPDNVAVFFQPSGMSEHAENIGNLPPDYYTNMCEGRSEDWIDVYVHAKFGKSLAGQPVFRAFDRDFHIAKTPLRVIRMENYPIIIGADFGLTPAATLGQLDPRGRLLVHAELTSEGMGSLRFVREKLKPLLAQKFAGVPSLVIGDPAGAQRAQSDERSVFDVFRNEGFRILPARTNAIAGRVAAVDNWLTRQVDGSAALLIDPSCKALIAALRGGYRYKLKSNGEHEDKPEKNQASHIADAFQYLALHADPGSNGSLHHNIRREVQRVAYAY